MSLEIAGVVLDRLTAVDVQEGARFVRHAVPGLDGELAQALGRPSVRIQVQGICYGPTAADDLATLRGHLLGREPVDFLCEVTGQGYFSQVLVDALQVAQRAGRPDEFDFACALVEYVPPPPPPAADPFGAIDTSLIGEAVGLVDDMQAALGALQDLAGLLGAAGSFGDPTTRLPGMLDAVGEAGAGGAQVLATIRELL